MNREQQLISKLLDGAQEESLINELMAGIESGAFNRKEILKQIKIHSLLTSSENLNHNADSIMKAISAFEKPSSSISQKIINRLPPRKKSHWFSPRLAIAASLLLAFGMYFLYLKYSSNSFNSSAWKNSEYKVSKFAHDAVTSKLQLNKNYKLESDEYSEILSNDNLHISFQPKSGFYLENQKLILNSGQLLAQVPKQNKGSVIEFLAGKNKTTIKGTKFGISYFERNQQKEFLLELSEGSVHFANDKTQDTLSPNQYIYFNEKTGFYKKGDGLIELDYLSNNKTIHQAPAKYEWIPFFWELWDPNMVSIVENGRYLKITGEPGKTKTLLSRLVKSFGMQIHYGIKLRPIAADGKYEMGLKCYYKGKLSFMDSFEMVKKGNQCQLTIKKLRNGNYSSEPSQTVEASNLRDFNLKGDITHGYRSEGDNHEFTKEEIEEIQKNNPNRDVITLIDDITFEIFVTCDENSKGSVLLTDIFVKR